MRRAGACPSQTFPRPLRMLPDPACRVLRSNFVLNKKLYDFGAQLWGGLLLQEVRRLSRRAAPSDRRTRPLPAALSM